MYVTQMESDAVDPSGHGEGGPRVWDVGHGLVCYESITLKQEVKRRPIYVYRCDERLKAKAEGYTGLRGGLEHLEIETRFIDEMLRGVCLLNCCLLNRQKLFIITEKAKVKERR